MSRPPFLIAEDAAVYHGNNREYLSSHRLADFRRCPQLFHRQQLGLVAPKDSAAYLLGRAAHTRILEGEAVFAERYTIGGPTNPSTGQPFGRTSQAFRDYARAADREVLTATEAAQVERLATAAWNHPLVPGMLSWGVAEGVCRAEVLDVPCQARLDYLHPEHGILDLKTCDDLDAFEADARRFGYLHQVAFYRAVLRAAASETYPVHFLAVEKKEPNRAGVWLVAEPLLDVAEAENAAAIAQLKHCAATGTWPTGYETLRVFDRA